MNTTPFAALLGESLKGHGGFLERWRNPGLLIESVHGKRPTELDGRSPYPLRTTRTATRLGASGSATLEAPRYPYLEDANIVWVQKSPRSSFTQIVSLGRGADNDLRFDLDELSTIHATFARSGDRWYVQDHNSKNGTFVNGERLEAGSLRRLSEGDTLRFGDALEARFFSAKGLLDFLGIVNRVSPTLEANG